MTDLTHKEVLEKAITLAIKNGWHSDSFSTGEVDYDGQHWVLKADNPSYRSSLFDLIFNHDFCKAIWGEETVYLQVLQAGGRSHRRISKWQFNLQQMVIADDPLTYLGEHL